MLFPGWYMHSFKILYRFSLEIIDQKWTRFVPDRLARTEQNERRGEGIFSSFCIMLNFYLRLIPQVVRQPHRLFLHSHLSPQHPTPPSSSYPGHTYNTHTYTYTSIRTHSGKLITCLLCNIFTKNYNYSIIQSYG